MGQCHYCRHTLSADVQNKNRLCPNCASDIHACRNCTHFNEDLTTKCREPHSPWVADRSSQNNCPYFEFLEVALPPERRPDEALSESERAKEAFRALFRTPSA